MKTSATNKRLRVLLTGIRDKTLVPNPDFQRRLVWSNNHKVEFVRTVLEGLPFPEIFIAAGEVNPDTGDGNELIVDGQQRITTLFQYFTGSRDLKLLPADLVPFADLSNEAKLEFLEYEVVVRDLGPLSEVETRAVFQRINSTNYALNAMEINNSRFDGQLKVFAQELAESKFFSSRNVFTSLDVRRMNDVRFVLTVIITLMSGYFNRDDELERYLEVYNDEFPERTDIETRIERVLALLTAANIDRGSRLWQKADLLTAIVELDRLLDEMTILPGRLHVELESFYERVGLVTKAGDVHDPLVTEYYRRVKSGVNDRNSRIQRGESLRGTLMQEL